MLLLRIIPFTSIFWFSYLSHEIAAQEQVPVWYARVRDSQDESEHIVRLKGIFSYGNVAPDDLVSFGGNGGAAS